MRTLKQLILLVIIALACTGVLGAGEHVWTTNGPKGGRINAIVYDPIDRETVYLSVQKGGIYRSVNGGRSWRQVASEATLGIEPHCNNQVNRIAVDPINNNILYAAGYAKVVKSIDGGLNWQALETGVSGFSMDIVIHPADPDTLFIATYDGIFKSTDAGSNWTAVDNGLTYTTFLSLAVSPANPNILYAGCGDAPVLFKTTDGGASWNTVYSCPTAEGIGAVAVDPTNAGIVYTSAGEDHDIMKSTDGGDTWNNIYIEYVIIFANAIVVDPLNSGNVYWGGTGFWLYNPDNYGSNWTDLTNGIGLVGAFAVNSFDNDNLLVGTMAGIFRSGNGGKSWSKGNSGLNYTHITALAIDPADPDYIYVATLGGGVSISTDGGTSWSASNIDGLAHSIDAVAVDPVSTNIVYIGETFGQIYKSTNSGSNWTEVLALESGNNGAPHAIVIDPGNTDIVYAGMARDGQNNFTHSNPRGIFKSVDAGATWNESNTGLTNLDVRTVIIDPSNTNTLYAGTVGSGVFKTVNGAVSWNPSHSGITNLNIRALALDATNTNIIYAGTNGGGIFKSIDGGTTWAPINSGLTNLYISSLAVDSTNGNKVFAGAQYPPDVFGSIDGGTSWVEVNEGLPSDLESIEAIVISPANSNLLYIGTYGGGVYQRTIDPETIILNPPQISLNRTRLFFGAAAGTTTPSQNFLIENSGGSTLNWTITDNADWLSCTPLSGTDSGSVTISVDSSGLAAGTYTGTVTVSSPGAANSPRTVSVSMEVYEAGSTSGPFGQFSTPIDGSTVVSSVPVTGWALDDLGVESVKIYRGETGGLVYIGDAVFVEGARPDVEQAYPGYPMNYKAGWGYLMLTNFLPDGGNGTFKIHAIAKDIEGKSIKLGTTTMICDNANAVKPFGAIDTPAQGGTAFGSKFINWGWVLTPQPDSIPTDGSTIDVWVDGVNIGHPLYNIYRADIAGLFPGYANSNGAAGYFYLDTTAYSNGVHTIQWTAADSDGNTDGIGSRYFSIQNAGNSARGMGAVFCADFSGAVGIIKGYHHGEPQKVHTNDRGIIYIEIKELERLETHLNASPHPDSLLTPNNQSLKLKNTTSNHYRGYLMVGNQLKQLPIGSTLDTQRGIFYWQPGPGFIGEYRFVFVLKGLNNKTNRQVMIVKINPL